MMTWSDIYLEYCRVSGNTPEQQAELDTVDWPGGCMAGFLLWSRARYDEFCKLHSVPRYSEEFFELQGSYIRWLKNLPIGHGVPV